MVLALWTFLLSCGFGFPKIPFFLWLWLSEYSFFPVVLAFQTFYFPVVLAFRTFLLSCSFGFPVIPSFLWFRLSCYRHRKANITFCFMMKKAVNFSFHCIFISFILPVWIFKIFTYFTTVVPLLPPRMMISESLENSFLLQYWYCCEMNEGRKAVWRIYLMFTRVRTGKDWR